MEKKINPHANFNNELPDIIGINRALAGIPISTLARTFKAAASSSKEFKRADIILIKNLPLVKS